MKMAFENMQKPGNTQGEVLNAFSRALTREVHVLTHQPDILWQQLYNHLQWEGKEVKQVLTPELEQRSEPGVRPWFHNKCRTMESEAFIRLLKSHTKPVLSCAFSPDGRTLASASWDKTLRLWDARTGEEQVLLKGHTGNVTSCAFSPDGRTLASASWDYTVRLWDVRTGEEQTVLKGHIDWVNSCAFSPDGHTLASASKDKTIRLWDARSGETIDTFPCPGNVNACTFNPSGEMLATGDSGGNIYILELIGFDTKPIIITAAKGNQGLVVRCPACQKEHPVSQEQLGSELTCPTPDCGLRLKLNPFVIQPLFRENHDV